MYDIVLAGTDLAEINRVKALLDEKFNIKDLGTLKYFLGFEVARNTVAHHCARGSMLLICYKKLDF